MHSGSGKLDSPAVLCVPQVKEVKDLVTQEVTEMCGEFAALQ